MLGVSEENTLLQITNQFIWVIIMWKYAAVYIYASVCYDLFWFLTKVPTYDG